MLAEISLCYKNFLIRFISMTFWSPWSQDLTLPHAFLWCYLKDRVFERGPATIEELKQCIKHKINASPHAALHRIFQDMLKRLCLCKREQTGHT